jgi:hypothetical protein
MPDGDDFGLRDRPHITIDRLRERAAYQFPPRRQSRTPLRENHADHARALLDQLASALGNVPPADADPRLQLEGLKPGVTVAISTLSPPESSRTKAVKVPTGLEFPHQDIVVLRSERNDDRTESAVLFIPDDARVFLQDRIAEYGRNSGDARPSGMDRFEAVETFRAAPVDDLFVEAVDLTDPELRWWELWVRNAESRADRLAALARASDIDVHGDRLQFPDTTVLFIHSAARALATFAARVPGAIAEIRIASGTIEPFLERGSAGAGPQEWVDELAGRVVQPPQGAPVVCALDTGVNAEHPLVAPGLRGAWAYDAAWGTDDDAPDGGHGTPLSGLILYGDLEPLMSGSLPVELTHGAESMKLLPPHGFPPTQPPSYGVVTQGAVALVETERPGVLRSFCLATSTTDHPPGRPSTWSGALDQVAAGAMPGEVGNGVPATDTPKRLLVVATGNVSGGMLVNVEPCQPLEDPAQSWNALTIGGFTRKDRWTEFGMDPVVPANHRSPYSRGSQSLPDDLTPIKPEVLFEAGNMLSDSSGFCAWHPSVSLLSTGSNVVAEPLVPFWATSAAAGMAGNFFGRLQAAHPDRWPETLRALAVDSASWPQPIRRRLVGRGAHWRTGSKREKQQILREVGYGVPDIERAILSARNDVTLVAEAEIQPFTTGSDGRSAVYNEMHFYSLPWPRTALEQLENEIVTMKVTLSYFIEPNLAGKAATRPDTYRSFGLRFAMKQRGESETQFRARVTAAQAKDGSESTGEASHWLLGPRAVQAGSLHCDLWRGYAIDLAGHDSIAVYPVGGWWKSHTGQRRMNDRGRYALVISISATDHNVDLHAEVESVIEVREIELGIG